MHEKTTESKILSNIKESTRNQKADRKMKRRKRETGSGVSSNRSNIASAIFRAFVCPKYRKIRQRRPINQKLVTPEPQIITSEVIIAPPPTGQLSEVTIPSIVAPVEALQ